MSLKLSVGGRQHGSGQANRGQHGDPEYDDRRADAGGDVTFGWIFTNLLDSKGSNAMMLAGVLLALGAVAMLWVNPPDESDESPIMPLGSKRSISVYERVVVGSDGTPTSLYAVDRAAEVAQAAQARLIVVTAYRDSDPSTASSPAEGMHRDLHGSEAARKALEKSVTGLTKERARYIEQRLVVGDPAKALLDTVGSNPANLIVVGNRGLGANEGQLLGSVPRDVVKDAVCDVLVVQTSALDEDRIFSEEPAEATADDIDPVTESHPGGGAQTR